MNKLATKLASWPVVVLSFMWLLTLSLGELAPDWVSKVRFAMFPVVTMKGEMIERTPTYAVLHIYGEKHRGAECKYLGIQAFGDRTVGLPVDLNIVRTDMPSDGKTKPPGVYDTGNWRVWPILGVHRVRVYVEHDCLGTRVGTQIAEVDI